MKEVVRVEGLKKSFGSHQVLNGVNLQVNQGEIIALLGRSGCGKSTLIKSLVGYHQVDSGKIFFKGNNVAKNTLEMRKVVGYTTQDNSFYEDLTVQENMKYYASLYKIPKKEQQERIGSLLKSVGLHEHTTTLAGSISGGMKRRLDFALSLLHKPKLVVLDEPTTGLDPVLVEIFWDVVTSIVKEQRIAVLVSSHHLHEVQQHCTKAIYMKQGKVEKITTITAKTNIDKEFTKYT